MSMTDPIADMITRLRNGQMVKKKHVRTPVSKVIKAVLDVLAKEGYIIGYQEEANDNKHPELNVELKYYEGEPVIHDIQRVSKPGLRVYSKANDLPRAHNGLGTYIVSTPRGVMTEHDARVANVGGEILVIVF